MATSRPKRQLLDLLPLKPRRRPILSHGPELSFRALPYSCLLVYGSQSPNPSLFNVKATNPVLDWHEAPTTLRDISGHSRRCVSTPEPQSSGEKFNVYMSWSPFSSDAQISSGRTELPELWQTYTVLVRMSTTPWRYEYWCHCLERFTTCCFAGRSPLLVWVLSVLSLLLLQALCHFQHPVPAVTVTHRPLNPPAPSLLAGITIVGHLALPSSKFSHLI